MIKIFNEIRSIYSRLKGKPIKYIVWKVYHLALLNIERRKYKNFHRYYSFETFCRECGFPSTDIQSLCNYFSDSNKFSLYRDWNCPENIVQEALRRYPESREEVIRKAEEICEHVFDLLGSGPVHLGHKIDWHCDFKTGRRWPPMYYRDIDYNNLDKSSDVKVAWELARFQHFTVLGKAYLYTKDEKYAREFISQWTDFVEENPVGMSVNWACTMDVALRAINWIWAYHFFRHSPSFDPPKQARFLYELACHGKFILRNMEYSDVNGNHYLSDGAGLVFLGLFLNIHPDAKEWLSKGKEIVLGEIEKQISADGVDFEKSIPYHRLVMELFLDSVLLLEANGHEIPAVVLSRIERMAEFVKAYIKPNGDIPLIGDADDGRMHILGNQDINDHRYLLSTCAARFDRSDFKAAAGKLWEESYWKLGFEQIKVFDNLTDIKVQISSMAFRDGGFFILKSSDDYMIIDCGDVGLKGRGGHGHNDILSFELYSRGITWLTDCGAYLYTASPKWRNLFRSTAFHNALMVDDEEIARLGDSLWSIKNDARPVFKDYRENDEYAMFVGGHTGYLRLTDPVMHYRTVLYLKNSSVWFIKDSIECRDKHNIKRMHQLYPEVDVCLDAECATLYCDGRKFLICDLTDDNLFLKYGKGFVSPSYGKINESTRLIMENNIDSSKDLYTSYSIVHIGESIIEAKKRVLREFSKWMQDKNNILG